MPAYSFKEQFVPFVEDYSKPHTIRNRRKNHAKVGDRIYLYFGMRTKWTRKLGESTCSNTHSIGIDKFFGIIFYSRLLANDELKWANILPNHVNLPISKILTTPERDQFAWMDGFRPAGSTKETPGAAFDLMIKFWTATHELPWAGDIIYWHPLLKPATIQ